MFCNFREFKNAIALFLSLVLSDTRPVVGLLGRFCSCLILYRWNRYVENSAAAILYTNTLCFNETWRNWNTGAGIKNADANYHCTGYTAGKFGHYTLNIVAEWFPC